MLEHPKKRVILHLTVTTNRIRPFSFSIGNMPIKLVEAIVDEESTLTDEHCYGNVGIAAVLQYRKTILNFRDMFVKFEN